MRVTTLSRFGFPVLLGVLIGGCNQGSSVASKPVAPADPEKPKIFWVESWNGIVPSNGELMPSKSGSPQLHFASPDIDIHAGISTRNAKNDALMKDMILKLTDSICKSTNTKMVTQVSQLATSNGVTLRRSNLLKVNPKGEKSTAVLFVGYDGITTIVGTILLNPASQNAQKLADQYLDRLTSTKSMNPASGKKK